MQTKIANKFYKPIPSIFFIIEFFLTIPGSLFDQFLLLKNRPTMPEQIHHISTPHKLLPM
jgi:hypothetical protein